LKLLRERFVGTDSAPGLSPAAVLHAESTTKSAFNFSWSKAGPIEIAMQERKQAQSSALLIGFFLYAALAQGFDEMDSSVQLGSAKSALTAFASP
jgi:hypothetical protein